MYIRVLAVDATRPDFCQKLDRRQVNLGANDADECRSNSPPLRQQISPAAIQSMESATTVEPLGLVIASQVLIALRTADRTKGTPACHGIANRPAIAAANSQPILATNGNSELFTNVPAVAYSVAAPKYISFSVSFGTSKLLPIRKSRDVHPNDRPASVLANTWPPIERAQKKKKESLLSTCVSCF